MNHQFNFLENHVAFRNLTRCRCQLISFPTQSHTDRLHDRESSPTTPFLCANEILAYRSFADEKVKPKNTRCAVVPLTLLQHQRCHVLYILTDGAVNTKYEKE